MKTGIALSLFLTRATSPEKRANTPERTAIINKTAGIGSLKKLGLSFGPCEITIVWLKIKNRANDKRANTEYLPSLLFGMNKSFVLFPSVVSGSLDRKFLNPYLPVVYCFHQIRFKDNRTAEPVKSVSLPFVLSKQQHKTSPQNRTCRCNWS